MFGKIYSGWGIIIRCIITLLTRWKKLSRSLLNNSNESKKKIVPHLISIAFFSLQWPSEHRLPSSDLSSIITSSGRPSNTLIRLNPLLPAYCPHPHDKFLKHHASLLVGVSKVATLHLFVHFFDKCLSFH